MRLKGGATTTDPRLDRVASFDPRSKAFPIRELIGDPPLRSRSWRLLQRLDQGQEGACVGFGFGHELAAQPAYVRVDAVKARWIYQQAQLVDEWPGEAYSGTSVLAGAKVVQSLGHMESYRWAFGINDVLATLSHHGPVVIGVPWFQGMFRTDSDGYIRPTGSLAGGHCVCLRGLKRERGEWVVIGRNSWGRSWGVGGDFKVRATDLDALLQNQGDACVPVGRA